MKQYGTIMESYYRNYSTLHTTKQALTRVLAKKLCLGGSRRAEVILRTTLRCLCMHLPGEEIGALAFKLPTGMKCWANAKSTAGGRSDLHNLLQELKDCCGFRSMEEALVAAKSAISVLGLVVDLSEFGRLLPEELRELALQVKEEQALLRQRP